MMGGGGGGEATSLEDGGLTNVDRNTCLLNFSS